MGAPLRFAHRAMARLVLLLRHGQADFDHGRLAGRTPGVHLSERGREEARALAERLRPVRLNAIYSSPLERCLQTAEAVADGRRLDVHVEEGVKEVDFGSWQGRPYKTLAKTSIWRQVQLVPSQASFPGGESVRDLQERCVDAVERIRTRHGKGIVAVASHADAIKVTAAHYLGMHLDLFQRIVIPTASVTAIAFGDGFPRILRLGDTGSFDEFAPPKRTGKRS